MAYSIPKCIHQFMQAWAAAIPGKKFEFLDFNSKQKMSLSAFSFELMPTSTQNVYIGTRLTKNAKITNKKFNFWKLPIHLESQRPISAPHTRNYFAMTAKHVA